MIERPEGGRRPVVITSFEKTNKAESGLAVKSIEGLNVVKILEASNRSLKQNGKGIAL